MALFFTADTHFWHSNIIRLCNRPFRRVEAMNETLIANWNSVVRPKDTIIHLGDFSWAGAAKTKAILERLNGHKILIKGNHDRGRSIDCWKEWGFEEAYNNAKNISAITQWDSQSRYVILSHEPLPADNVETMYNAGAYIANVHGHTHNSPTELNQHIYKCVSVELTDYTPVNIEDLQDWFAGGVR